MSETKTSHEQRWDYFWAHNPNGLPTNFHETVLSTGTPRKVTQPISFTPYKSDAKTQADLEIVRKRARDTYESDIIQYRLQKSKIN